MLGEGVYQVGRRDGFGDAVAPAARFDEIVEEQRDDVVRLDEGAVEVDDAEAVGVAVGGDADGGAGLLHLRLAVAEQVVVRFGRVTAEKHVAVVVDGGRLDAVLAQNVAAIAARRSPEGIENDFDSGLS